MDISCPHHPNEPLIEDHRAGDVICPKCGTVVGDRCVDVGTEWRSFSNEKSGNDPSRVGAPENNLLGGSDLSTTMAFTYNSTSYDEGLASAQRRTSNNGDKQMQQALKTIGELCERMKINKKVKDMAGRNFRSVLDSKILKGKNSEAQAAACLYIACRQAEVARTFKEICAACNVSKKEIGKCFRVIMKENKTNLGTVNSSDYMARFCSLLELPPNTKNAAIHIIENSKKFDLVAGRSPVSIAAAAIYMAVNGTFAQGKGKTPNEISEVTGAAEVTVKQTYKLLLPRAKDLFPAGFEFVTPVECFPQ
uniref:Transcription initiation factor IIB n=1 Tax=Rhabditophanes sp. KR3021 TaxID=114890 RepID=A0AC35UHY7_9BILA